MPTVIRIARGGSKKRPFYRIVVADSKMRKDGRFLEKVGTYNPLLPKDSEQRVQLNIDRIQEWMAKGAEPTDRVKRFLEQAGMIDNISAPSTIETKVFLNSTDQQAMDNLSSSVEAFLSYLGYVTEAQHVDVLEFDDA